MSDPTSPAALYAIAETIEARGSTSSPIAPAECAALAAALRGIARVYAIVDEIMTSHVDASRGAAGADVVMLDARRKRPGVRWDFSEKAGA